MNRKLENSSLDKGTHRGMQGARKRMDVSRQKQGQKAVLSAQGLTSILHAYKYSVQ